MMTERRTFITLAILAVIASCGKPEEVIPDRVQPDPDPTPATSEYNDLGIDLRKDGDPYDTYRGLVMAGYQGWFGTPGDGSPMTAVPNQGWYHYRESEQFRPGVLRNSIDFWPDMSEYDKKYVVGDGDGTGYSSPFILPDGSHATVFSSYDESTVLTHFRWMKEYGLDGVFMQRFVGEIQDAKHKDHFDTVLKHAMKGSNQYQRAIAVMYDMGGVTASNPSMAESMVKDAQELMDQYKLKDRSTQKYYLFENGKPLLALWGIAFNDDSHPKPSYLEPYIDRLIAQGWAIMLGCPAYWRQGGGDCVTGSEHTKLISLIKKCDAFIPWYVGRYGYDNFTGDDWQSRIKQDISTAKGYSTDDHIVVYAEHIYPGGSDRNMHPNNGYPDGDATQTGYRYGGKFYWSQFYHDIKAGVQAVYVGMFDEIDEGTAIFKQMTVSQVPSNVPYNKNSVPSTYGYATDDDYWVTYTTDGSYRMNSKEQTGTSVVWSRLASDLDIRFQGIDDDKGTDWYLKLTGAGAKMLRGEIKMSSSIPSSL